MQKNILLIGGSYAFGAAIAAFLLNEDSQWITGQVFGVDGGLSSLNIN